MDQWNICYHEFIPDQEMLREALCTLGNGFFATRGAGSETSADGIHYPGTYLAGGYNRLSTEIAGHVVENEDLVNIPNWLPISFRIDDGKWFSLKDVTILEYEQRLCMLEGTLYRKVRFEDQQQNISTINTRRLVSMDDRHVAAIEMTIESENWDGVLEVSSGLDGRVENKGVERYKKFNSKHLEPVACYPLENNAIFLQVKTNQSNMYIAECAKFHIWIDDDLVENITHGIYQEDAFIAMHFKFPVQKKQTVRLEKVVTLYTSKDSAISECGLDAQNHISDIGNFDTLLDRHKLSWKHLWKRFNIQIHADSKDHHIIQILHLHLFHLLQTISLHTLDLDSGVPARGWHGEAYRGHIFWDELFIFPILNLQFPELTRALLLYRFRRLPEARRFAKQEGLKGAMYPWQSGSSGREESQKLHLNPKSGRWIPDNSKLQRHVNAAVAYNIWQHYQATHDLEFLCFYGIEMMLEIARFFASLTTFSQDKDRYEVLGVMGPDEFHDAYPDSKKPGIDNNAYTNVMVSWVLSRTLDALNEIPKDRKVELEEKLALEEDELQAWDHIRKQLFIPFHTDGVISQFEGYEKLQELDWKKYRKKYGDIHRMDRILEAENDTPNKYKLSKQGDVLMLFYLFSAEELRDIFSQLGYALTTDMIQNTIHYYVERSTSGSTLSHIVDSWVLARLKREASWKIFCQALISDISDVQGGTTKEGIHLGAMAGTVDLLQRCFPGLEYRGDVLRFSPQLPDELHEMKTEIRYRGHSLSLSINHKKMTITSKRVSASPIKIGYKEKLFSLKEGKTVEITLQ